MSVLKIRNTPSGAWQNIATIKGEKGDKGDTGGNVTDAVKLALLQIAKHIWYDDDNDYPGVLQDALFSPDDVVSISAVYTQSGTVYNTDELNDLKADLVVKATMTGGTIKTIAAKEYLLDGELVPGTSTISVVCLGLVTTFDVAVTRMPRSDMYGWLDGSAYVDLEIVEGSWVRSATGAVVANSNKRRTGYVPCDGAGTITFPPYPSPSSEYWAPDSNFFYDENKQPIGSKFVLSKTASVTVNVPSNAYYWIISGDPDALIECVNGGIVPHA